METNKLLALAQHLNIPFIEDGADYYFGVELPDYEDYLSSLDEDFVDEYTGVEDWARKQDSYIDFENDVEVNGDYYTYEGEEYLILDNDEADSAWEDSIDNHIDECVLPDVPERYRQYFDREAFMNDCEHDGRGHTLATYDGEEREVTVDMETYYLYRAN